MFIMHDVLQLALYPMHGVHVAVLGMFSDDLLVNSVHPIARVLAVK